MRKYKQTKNTPWRVEFKQMAYDDGGYDWDQYYWTKVGAMISKFWHLYIASWGGKAKLVRVDGPEEKEDVALYHPHSVFCEGCGGWTEAKIISIAPHSLQITCVPCGTVVCQVRTKEH